MNLLQFLWLSNLGFPRFYHLSLGGFGNLQIQQVYFPQLNPRSEDNLHIALNKPLL